MNIQRLFNLVIVSVCVFSWGGMPKPVLAQEADPVPSVDIDVTTNSAYASDWPVGSNVTISFDDPANGTGWDYSKTVAVPYGWAGCGWCQFIISIDPTEFRIKAGQVVRITDGTTTRQATIPDLIVTSVDFVADTISGNAPAGSIVNLEGPVRHAIADSSGQWFADLAHSGPGNDEWETLDLVPNTGFVWISLTAGDYVSVKFQSGFGPFFSVFPEDHQVTTKGWPFGATLTLTIDDPATIVDPDLTRTQTVHEEWSGWSVVSGATTFEDLGTILPGFTVSITDGLVFKTHTVTHLAVTDVNASAETVSGTAEPGSLVDAGPCDDQFGCAWLRTMTAGENRNWLADFSVGEDIYDIVSSTEGEAQQSDIDSDATAIIWRAPLDGDGDGLTDGVDACPNENPNGYDADHDGCIDGASGLMTLIQNMPTSLIANNIKQSLLVKADSAIKSIGRGQENTVIRQLQAFINEVEAQRGKKIADETADLLIAYARNVIAGIP